jgi:ubiquitin-conjugating enzyme E2 C
MASPDGKAALTPSAAAVTRLQRELREFLQHDSDGSISAFPQDDDIFSWSALIAGSAGTMYEGLEYRLCIRFPHDYPFRAPVVAFQTPCFHPNVEAKVNGFVCLDILREQWSAVLSLSSVLVSLQSLLNEPNCASPLNQEAADMWRRGDMVVYREKVLSYHALAAPPR